MHHWAFSTQHPSVVKRFEHANAPNEAQGSAEAAANKSKRAAGMRVTDVEIRIQGKQLELLVL